jgi:hypothetical protein
MHCRAQRTGREGHAHRPAPSLSSRILGEGEAQLGVRDFGVGKQVRRRTLGAEADATWPPWCGEVAPSLAIGSTSNILRCSIARRPAAGRVDFRSSAPPPALTPHSTPPDLRRCGPSHRPPRSPGPRRTRRWAPWGRGRWTTRSSCTPPPAQKHSSYAPPWPADRRLTLASDAASSRLW